MNFNIKSQKQPLGVRLTKHHGVLLFGLVLVFISLSLILLTVKSRRASEAIIDNDNQSKTVNSVTPSISQSQKTNTNLSPLQSKNYNDYGLTFSIPNTWFESENTVTPSLYVSFKKSNEAEMVVSTAKSYVGHGVEGELVTKEKINVSSLEGDIQVWEIPQKIRTIIVNNLEKDGLFYTFEIYIYQNFETNETDFRDLIKSIKLR